MGLWERLARWLTAPPAGLYRCAECGRRFTDARAACPECGGEIGTVEPSEELAPYWGPM